MYVENVAIDKLAITDLADIEGDDYVIKFDQDHFNLIQYHINGELIILKVTTKRFHLLSLLKLRNHFWWPLFAIFSKESIVCRN